MALTDFFDLVASTLSFAELHAEAPPAEENDGGDEDSGDKEEGGEDGEDSSDEGGDGEEGGEEEEEEEDDDEPEDIKPKLEEECAQSAQCAPLKHHYEECAERVTRQHEDPDHKGPKEDCVEEFFHLQHCAAQCAAPKLFRALK